MRNDFRTAVITGASSGIGEATAHAFAAAGIHVALLARRADRLAELAAAIEANGGRALAVPTDLTDPGAPDSAASEVVDHFGRVDILVNNAGVFQPGSSDPESWRLTVDVNLTGALLAVNTFLPELLKSAAREGVADIVSVSSISARRTFTGTVAYTASKAGLSHATEVFRAELAPNGVRTTTVEPGLVDTEIYDHIANSDARAGVRSLLDACKPLRASDVAELITFAVTRPAHVSFPSIVTMPTRQI
ncbi:SDR family oxidoreductase [Allokutzneria sp. A3M-2-11 16]|uniref:SDR family oxidoreductase n=1 Tax=Allokutzneria sp. A3M-2-11 16 TaxID=2962043 RepID=UPI0020B8D983|nr:SDR family oxidoreductase [Allokutzneria sp. A3M-2-11 16]MCP3804469.1 SDR family oxidoreductase [Allokutzneria sp. A3M-2-11 16]